MSEVISFRLDRTNPREARAIEVLNAWLEKGYSARYILTKALLVLNHPGSDSRSDQDDREMRVVMDKIGHLIEIVEAMKEHPISGQSSQKENPALRENFIASGKLSARPGIKAES